MGKEINSYLAKIICASVNLTTSTGIRTLFPNFSSRSFILINMLRLWRVCVPTVVRCSVSTSTAQMAAIVGTILGRFLTMALLQSNLNLIN